MSIDTKDLPESAQKAKQRTFRSVSIDGAEIEFSDGFADLHTVVYKETLAGRGFGLETARASIELVHDIRVARPSGINTHTHPWVMKR